MSLIRNGVGIAHESGFHKNHINPLRLEFKKILLEQTGEDLNCIRREETTIETISNK